LTAPYARPDLPALAELAGLLEALEKELGTWRERCLKAEQDLTQGKGRSHTGPELLQARQRSGLLEGENKVLQQRIAAAREHIEQLKSRLRFVEEHDAEGAA
jgi:predicted  nucleic acid-binding Zn-ribbon protein